MPKQSANRASGRRSSLDSTLSSPTASAVSKGIFPDSLPNSPDSATVQLPLEDIGPSSSQSSDLFSPSSHTSGPAHGIKTTTFNDTPSYFPAPTYSDAPMPNSGRDYEVHRPPFGTVNSSTGLLSADQATATGDRPAPTDTRSPLSAAPIAGSHPTTPEVGSTPTLEAPFASGGQVRANPGGTILTQRRSSAVPHARSPSPDPAAEVKIQEPDEPESKREQKRESKRSITGLPGLSGLGNFAQRRSLRSKNARSVVSNPRDSRLQAAKENPIRRKPFQSTRLKGEIYKPWTEKVDPAQRWARWITLACIVIGLGLCAFLCYDGYASVPNLGKVCSVLDESFSTLDTNVWQREVRLDGYGHGEFTWTTDDNANSYVDNGVLYIVPTLTSDVIGEDKVSNGYTLNLTADGTCTSTNVSQCVATSNTSLLTVINPVRTARLITKKSVSLKYGKVEVRAKFPTGDWLWPQISLLPVNETYGKWPRNGQIDILNGRGNNVSYSERGVDYAQSDLHWGPSEALDRLYLTWGYREQRRTYYNQKYHTFGLEWNDKYMWTYIDSKVAQVISLRFNKQSFWTRGKFPSTITNTTSGEVKKLINPWLESNKNVAPFDQSYYLMLTLGVGGIDGWFPDGQGGKPWIDSSGTAMYDFWNAKSKWWDQNWSTDPKTRGFAIDSVKMWQTC